MPVILKIHTRVTSFFLVVVVMATFAHGQCKFYNPVTTYMLVQTMQLFYIKLMKQKIDVYFGLIYYACRPILFVCSFVRSFVV